MRIVQVVDSLSFGGAERVAVDLASQQQASGDETAIVCLRHDGPLGDQARKAEVPLFVFDKQPGISWTTVLKLTSLLRRHRPHVVHSHNPGVHYYAVVAAKLANVPVVVNTCHSPMNSSRSLSRMRRFRWTIPFTDKVVFVSGHARSVLAPQLRLQDEKCCVIQNGVDVGRFSNAAQCRASALRFGTVGRMVPVKAHRTLIQAFSDIAPDVPTATLRIIGGGPLLKELRRYASEAKLDGRVIIEEETADVSAVLRDLDVFVMSSESEGLPLSLLEAMAAGLPVVATAVGGVPELVRDGVEGWLCPAKDVKGLATVLRKAAVATELARMGHSAAIRVREQFQLSTMFQSYRELFTALVARQGAC